jgi:hypothetical protein
MYLKVNKNINLIISYFLGIGLIKKPINNQIELLPEFYNLKNKNGENIIELDEEKSSDNVNQLELEKINKEISFVNYLINKVDEKLLFFQNRENENNIKTKGKILNILYKQLLQSNICKNNNFGLIAAKSEGGLKIEVAHINDPKNIIDQKKEDMNIGKLQYDDEYLNLCSFSNRLYITSNNNNPINLIKLDSKNIKNTKEKEEINNNYFQFRNENENVLNYNNIFSVNNNENKYETNFGLIKKNHIDNKIRKDSIVSDFSFYGNLNSFNLEINNIINNNIL